MGISLRDLWFCLRQDLVRSAAYPEKIDMIRDNLLGSHNVFDEENDERADWVEDMRNAPDHGFIKETAEVIYFTGCVSSYFPTAQRIPLALTSIFQYADVNFTLLGEEEWCCGFPLLGAGLGDLVKEIMDHNMNAVRAKGAKKIVFACPSCYQMWREHYPREFEIFHATQFLGDLLRRDAIPLKELSLTVTYHDPCDLGRGSDVYDEPREIIGSIPGVRFVELHHNRGDCRCCGGGGNLEMIDTQLSGDIAKEKIEEIVSTGATTVVTACQQCVRTMHTYVRRNKISLDVMDITQLIEKALDK